MEQFQVHGARSGAQGGHPPSSHHRGQAPAISRFWSERVLPDLECQVSCQPRNGFRPIGSVIKEFFERTSPGGCGSRSTTAGASRHGYPAAHAERAADGGQGMSNRLQTFKADWYEPPPRAHRRALDRRASLSSLGRSSVP